MKCFVIQDHIYFKENKMSTEIKTISLLLPYKLESIRM